MPFTTKDAHRHSKGLTAKEARQWVHVANGVLQSCLDDGGTDASCAPKAIIQANGVVKKAAGTLAEEPLYTALVKQDAPLRYTLGVVYAPLEVDTQGDFCKAETIQQAAWQFMRLLQSGQPLTKWSTTLLDAIVKAVRASESIRVDITTLVEDVTKAKRALGDQHSTWDEGLGEVVESYVMPCDVAIAGEVVKAGTWMLGVIWSEAYFAKIQAGERTGYSMGGTGMRRWVEDMSPAA